MLQVFLWNRMTCSWHNIPWTVLAQTLAYIHFDALYYNASSTALTAVVLCFQLKKKVLGLYATLYQSSDRTVEHYKLLMTTKWARVAFLRGIYTSGRGERYNRISVHVCERTDLYIAEQNIIIKKNNTPPIKEGDKKMYTRVVFFWRFFFFHSDIIRYSVDKRYGAGPRSTASPYKTFLVPPT